MKNCRTWVPVLFVSLTLGFSAFADDEMPLFKMTLKNHKFQPSQFKVPAEKKFRVEIKNEDNTSEEFESSTMNIEKVAGPKKTLKLILGPLKAGKYPFFGDFNKDTASGAIEAE